MAIGLFKEQLFKILLEPNDRIREKNLLRLEGFIETYVLQTLKGSDRKHNIVNKNKSNPKNSF